MDIMGMMLLLNVDADVVTHVHLTKRNRMQNIMTVLILLL